MFKNLLSFIFKLVIKPIFDLIVWLTRIEIEGQNKETGFIKPTSAIPGPYIWPILGDAHTLTKIGGPERFLDYVSHLHNEYGNIVKTKLGPQKFIFVNNPVLYKDIVRHDPRCPTSFKLPASEAFHKIHKINRGLFFQDGEEWYNGRALLTQLLLKDTGRFLETVFQPVEKVLEAVLMEWESKSLQNDGLITNIEQDCYEFFISCIMAITFGPNYKTILSMADSDSDVTKIANIAIKLNEATYDINAIPIGIATTFGLKCWKKYQEFTMYNLKLGRKCTDVALDLMRKTENGGSVEEFGLLHRLKNVCHASDEEARVHCTDFTFDISDPVSITTLWSIQALGRNTIVQNKILDEIESIFGKSQHALSYKDLEKLPYLNATFKEVLRIYPIAALVIRNPAEDVVIGGYNITSDHIIALSTFNSHKNSEYFSEPENFWPDRWLGGDFDEMTGKRVKCDDAYHPFGTGKRTCVGKHLVSTLVKLLMTKIVQNFVVESEAVEAKMKIVLYPSKDVKIKLIPRKTSNKNEN